MTMYLFRHQKAVWHIWIFSQYSLKLMTSLAWSFKYCTVCNLYGWRFRSLCRMQCTLLLGMPNAWACLCEIASDCGQQMQTLRQCSVVCKLRTSDPVTFYAWLNLHATAVPIDGLHLVMGSRVVSVHAKIHAESLMDRIWINSSTAHTHSLSSLNTILTNFKGHHFSSNTCTHNLAKERVITILKFFTIPAATCILATCWGGTLTWFGMPLVPGFSRSLK